MAEKVEKFKLSKEQLAWVKDYQKKAKAREMVKKKLMQQMAGAQRLQDMMGMLEQGMVRTLQLAPQKQPKELPSEGMSR